MRSNECCQSSLLTYLLVYSDGVPGLQARLRQCVGALRAGSSDGRGRLSRFRADVATRLPRWRLDRLHRHLLAARYDDLGRANVLFTGEVDRL